MPPTKDLDRSLAALGLSGHEPAVYAALLERSPAGAAWIARQCGLSRSSVYTTLGALVGKGLVATTHQDEVKQFVVEGPGATALVDLLRREQAQAAARVQLAEQLVERLARRGPPASTPQVVHFEGQPGLKRIYLNMLRGAPVGATMCILRDEFLWRAEWDFVREPEWRERVRRWKAEKNLSTHLLVNGSPAERGRAAWYRDRPHLQRRYLRQPVRDFALYVVGETAAILSLEDRNLIGIRVVNGCIAANLGQVFAGLWATARTAR